MGNISYEYLPKQLAPQLEKWFKKFFGNYYFFLAIST